MPATPHGHRRFDCSPFFTSPPEHRRRDDIARQRGDGGCTWKYTRRLDFRRRWRTTRLRIAKPLESKHRIEMRRFHWPVSKPRLNRNDKIDNGLHISIYNLFCIFQLVQPCIHTYGYWILWLMLYVKLSYKYVFSLGQRTCMIQGWLQLVYRRLCTIHLYDAHYCRYNIKRIV